MGHNMGHAARWMVLAVVAALVLPAAPSVIFAQAAFRVEPARQVVLLKGFTRGLKTATISAEVAARVVKVHYQEGDTVLSAPLFELDATFVDFDIRETRNGIAQAAVRRRQAESRTAFLEKEYQRIQALFVGSSIPESKRDSAAEEVAQSRLMIEAAAVEEQALKVHLDHLLERRQRHRIFGPPGWVLVEKRTEVGEFVSPGTPLGQVSDFRQLVVPLSLAGSELKAIQKLSSPFDVRLEGQPAKAAINWINPRFDEKTRKLAVELLVMGAGPEKRGGLVLTLPLEVETDGFQVPRAAVVDRYENPRVMLKADGRYQPIRVIGESADHLLIAEDPLLPPGTELALPR
jgi:hypothetical protein